MTGFIDETVIEVASGHGGAGAVSFRREKYVAKGGPDGGDGGKGGRLIFQVKSNLKTLFHLKSKHTFFAENGHPGQKRKKHGRDGADTVLFVPPGTFIKDFETHEVIKDLKEDGETWVFLEGGRGGKGNWFFRSARNQVPKFSQPGEPGKERKVIVELNLIADIGLVGLPNAGKSTLLSVLTNATPEIAAYPFTTKIPNLGVLKAYNQDIVIADIPGIIKGASHGAGLGIRFLKHISRTFLIILLIDLSDENFEDTIDILKEELGNFAGELLTKSKVIVGTKLDIAGTEDNLEKLKKAYPDERILGISSVTRGGLKELAQEMIRLISSSRDEWSV